MEQPANAFTIDLEDYLHVFAPAGNGAAEATCRKASIYRLVGGLFEQKGEGCVARHA